MRSDAYRTEHSQSTRTPAETHYDLVKQALEVGKDVCVEKPLALTCEQGAQLVRLAETSERILMVGHVLEYHPAILRLVDYVCSRCCRLRNGR